MMMTMLQLAKDKQLKVKRPCTGYMLFMSDFMKKNAKNYPSVQDAVTEGRNLLY